MLAPICISDQSTGYWVVIALSVLFGSVYAVLQASLYGLAGPAVVLLNNLNLGIGLSGMSINLVRIVLVASVSSNTVSAQIFFYISGSFLIVCTYLAWNFINNYNKE